MKIIALLLMAGGTITAQAPPPPPPPPPPPVPLAGNAAATCAVVSPEAAKMEFDAASVKPAGPFTPGRGGFGISGGPGSNDPGRVTMPRIALSTLIMTAYDLWPDQVQGPAWMTNMVESGFTISATMPAAITKEQYCGMLRNLLATRFHLTFRRETQTRPGYELTVMPGGPKFKEYVPGQSSAESAAGMRSDANGFPVMPPDRPTVLSFSMSANGLRKQSFRNNMALFARSVGPPSVSRRAAAWSTPHSLALRITLDSWGYTISGWSIRERLSICPPRRPRPRTALRWRRLRIRDPTSSMHCSSSWG